MRLDLRQLGRGHQHARRRIAGLAGVLEHVQHAAFHGALEVGVVEQHVGRFAAELLVYALDRGGRVARDFGAGAGRAGEGHHVDLGVRGERRADARGRRR